MMRLIFPLQSETGTIQKGYNDLTELIADYIRKGDQNGLSGSLIHPIPVEGMQEELESGRDIHVVDPTGRKTPDIEKHFMLTR